MSGPRKPQHPPMHQQPPEEDPRTTALLRQQYAAPTDEAYWNFVGPFGGYTAATVLRSVLEHPQRQGDPVSFTVNFALPLSEGAFTLSVRWQ